MHVQEEIRVSVTWTTPSSIKIMALEVQQSGENQLQYSTEVQINSSEAGMYSCEALIVATSSPYLTQSSTTSNTTEIHISMIELLDRLSLCMKLIVFFSK